MEAVWNRCVKTYKYLFPDYQCPACGGKLYKLKQPIDLEGFLKFFSYDVILTIIALMLSSLFGFVGFILVFVIFILFSDSLFSRFHRKDIYGCESCHQEFNYVDLRNSNNE